MENPLTQGLTLSAVGLVVAFAFMGIFILTMVALQKLFPAKKEAAAVEAPAEPAAVTVAPAQAPAAAVIAEADDELAVVAAVAAAVASLRSLSQSQLGAALGESHGTWWVANQLAARQSGLPVNK